MKILMSAYACEPGKGSEPGIGWHLACEAAKHHSVWVLTRANNRAAIESDPAVRSLPDIRFVYFDLPRWARWWKRGQRGVHLYYYLWQIGAYFVARRLHRDIRFDLVHHVTFTKYWAPSLLFLLRIPLVWGPAGGGESTPRGLWRYLDARGRLFEAIRIVARWLGEHDPLVLATARWASVALATTRETAVRLTWLGARNVFVHGYLGLTKDEMSGVENRPIEPGAPFRFISIGRLLQWKGIHIGLDAFSRAGLDGTEYWIVGAGPERQRLVARAARLRILNRVRFWGQLSRLETLERLRECHVLIHPSFHEAGGWVCAEAMGQGVPVVCFDMGGPGVEVPPEAGLKIAPDEQEPVSALCQAMRSLALDNHALLQMGRAGVKRVEECLIWEKKGELLAGIYQTVQPGAHRQEPHRQGQLVQGKPNLQR